jgi:hypothetical protein
VPNNEVLDIGLAICPECRCHYNPCRYVRSFDSEKLANLFKKISIIYVKEIGAIQKHYRAVQMLFSAYRIWKKALPSQTAVCSPCGYVVKVAEEASYYAKGNLNFKFLKYFYEMMFGLKYELS